MGKKNIFPILTYIVAIWSLDSVSNIAKAETVVIIPLTSKVPVQGSGDALPDNVLSGKSFTNDSGRNTGTMPNIGSIMLVPSVSNKSIPEGYHDGSGVIDGDADLIPENIKKGVSLFGVAGELDLIDTSSGNATSSDILRFKRAWVDGFEIVGTKGLFLGCSPSTNDWALNVCTYNCSSNFPLFSVDCEGFCNDIKNTIDTYFGTEALQNKCNF